MSTFFFDVPGWSTTRYDRPASSDNFSIFLPIVIREPCRAVWRSAPARWSNSGLTANYVVLWSKSGTAGIRETKSGESFPGKNYSTEGKQNKASTRLRRTEADMDACRWGRWSKNSFSKYAVASWWIWNSRRLHQLCFEYRIPIIDIHSCIVICW